jgi:DNA polymerase II small subunit|tara:strand:+ start:3142 stop:4572 length:1431 start_codon:yes stop_codon:yes gene_type:complete
VSLENETLQLFLNNKVQISKDALGLVLEQEKPLEAAELLLKNINQDIITILPKHIEDNLNKPTESTLSILENFEKNKPIRGVSDLSTFFNNRYTHFRKLLSGRLTNPSSVNSMTKMVKEKVSTIGLVCNKRTTAKGNILFELEDPTGTVKIVASGKEVRPQAETLVMDEAIGVAGTMGDGIMFADEIMWPDVPVVAEPKKLKHESYAIFLSDTHIGSKKFMEKEFKRFLSWLNGEVGGKEQQELVSKIKYCFLAGDIVDGIGIYPRQDEELSIANIEEQYQEAANYFSQVPNHIKTILSPGNHDFIRLGQPQPPLDPEVAEPLYKLKNIELVGNPATIKIAEHDNGGLDVLMYHGVSLDSLITADPTLKDGYTKPELVMKSLLIRRHLSPPYDTGLIASGQDQMVIRTVPDIFHAGHVHSNGNSMYRGINIINSGTWQGQTAFQKLCGHEPTPAILPLLNLQTRELNLVNFNFTDQ